MSEESEMRLEWVFPEENCTSMLRISIFLKFTGITRIYIQFCLPGNICFSLRLSLTPPEIHIMLEIQGNSWKSFSTGSDEAMKKIKSKKLPSYNKNKTHPVRPSPRHSSEPSKSSSSTTLPATSSMIKNIPKSVSVNKNTVEESHQGSNDKTTTSSVASAVVVVGVGSVPTTKIDPSMVDDEDAASGKFPHHYLYFKYFDCRVYLLSWVFTDESSEPKTIRTFEFFKVVASFIRRRFF